jgi:hypothetical protein
MTAAESQGAELAREVDGVCLLLISPSPEIMERCERVLEGARSALSDWRPQRSELHALKQLQAALGRAGRLLESAFQYHQRWRRRLDSHLGGYLPGGNPAVVAHPGRVILEG